MILYLDTKTTPPPICHHCGNNRQVWVNQITGLLTCHRLGCYRVVGAPGDKGVPNAPQTQ